VQIEHERQSLAAFEARWDEEAIGPLPPARRQLLVGAGDRLQAAGGRRNGRGLGLRGRGQGRGDEDCGSNLEAAHVRILRTGHDSLARRSRVDILTNVQSG
jgi:hypothetical protein